MPSDIFRKVSLDRLSSPEQIDQLLHVTSAREWVALLALCGIVVAGLIWSVTSFLHTTINAEGITSREHGLHNVVALGTGTVMDIEVVVGEGIREGQVIAHVAQPSLEQKLIQAKSELADAEAARARILEARAEEDRLKLAAMKQQIARHEQDIAHTEEQVRYAKEQVPVDDQLVAKGLITKQAAIQDRQKVASLESNVAQLGVQIAQVSAQEISVRNETAQLDLEQRNRISSLVRSLNLAEHSLKQASAVVAPGPGRVADIISYSGALVSSGQPILSYEPTHTQLQVLAYAPANKAKQIQPGMQAHISPSGVEREEYGYLIGKVRSVGYFPVTAEAITRSFESPSLARAMMAGGPVIEVQIDLLTSKTTPSGYVWSSAEGPPNPITSGSISSVEIVTRAQHPMELVVPYLKRKLGLK